VVVAGEGEGGGRGGHGGAGGGGGADNEFIHGAASPLQSCHVPFYRSLRNW
jgi:hypothetical protein